MGANGSKPAAAFSFKSDSPLSFTPELVEALQSSPETDHTRAKDVELKIQSRVETELQRLSTEVSKEIKKLPDEVTSSGSQSPHQHDELSHTSVKSELEKLTQKLNLRKQVSDLDDGVRSAQEEVVRCLRLHDRRPLDCWKEVDRFKQEVARLEKGFVNKVVE